MRRTTLMAGRIVSLCLAFVLGFFSAFGAIAGGIYFAYSSLSVDKLKDFGVNLPVDEFVDQNAEKPATSLTIQELVAEIQNMQASELTLEEMINRYGLILPEDFVEKVPDPVMNEIPFTMLFSPEGMQLVMDSVTVIDVLSMIPEDISGTIVSDPARDALSDNTLSDIVAMNMGHIFDGIQLGYLTGVHYELDENGVYQAVWADENNPTLIELIAPLDLGAILTETSAGGNGDVLGVIKNSIGHVVVNEIFDTFMTDVTLLSSLLGEATLGDLIVQNPDTGVHELDMMVAMEGKKIGGFLGYTEVEFTDPETFEVGYMWTDANGEQVRGVSAKFADILVTDLMNGQVSIDTILDDLILADVLGYTKGDKLPVFMHDNLENPINLDEEITIWYAGEVPADKMMNSFADKTIDWISTSVSTLKLADILGYVLYDGEWYLWEVKTVGDSDAIVLSPGSPIMTEIAGTPIGELSSIENTLKDVQIGTLLGYEAIYDSDDKFVFWSTGVDADGNPVKATGITGSLADLTINELSDGTTLQTTIDGIAIADVFGYTKGEDGKWYKGNELVTGPMAALAESKVGSLASDINDIAIGELLGHTPVYETDDDGNFVYDDSNNKIITHWVDGNNEKVDGIIGSFASLTIDDMKDNDKIQKAVKDVTVADVLGLYKDENGVWHNSDDSEATGIMSALAETTVGNISTKMQEITVGEMLGLYKDDKNVWRNSDGTRATGAVAALADATVGTLNTDLNNVKVGELLSYVYLESGDANANAGAGWYVYDEATDTYTKATGVTAALADSTISSMNTDLQDLLVGDVAGYTYNEDDHCWYDGNKKASGILAELADLTVNDLTEEGALTERIGNVKLAEALGYTYDTEKKAWVDKSNQPLDGIMAALADKPINNMNSAIQDLTLNDVLPGEKTGLLTIIPGDTPINNINGAINESITDTPLQFFIDQGLITFDANTRNMLDGICYSREQALGNGNYLIPIDEINDNYKDKYADSYTYTYTIEIGGVQREETVIIQDKVPVWRTKPLQDSFGFIVELISGN